MTQTTEVGRWIARQLVSGHWEIAENESGAAVARVTGPSGANARLIAAAPEGLDANKLSLRNVESLIYQLPLKETQERASLEAWAATLRATITKATGQ